MVDETRKGNEPKSFLDRRLEAATRSDDPEIIHNTTTALAALKGKVRLAMLVDLLVDLIRRVDSEAPGDDRYFPLLAHASRQLESLDRESARFVGQRVQAIEDPHTRVALQTLLPGELPDAEQGGDRPSPWARWRAARRMWPRYRFWYLVKMAAAAASLSALALAVILPLLASLTHSGANPWSTAEGTVLLTIVAIATFSAALSGWIAGAGGAAAQGPATLAVESLLWGLIGSLFAKAILLVAPETLPYMAWIRASGLGDASAGAVSWFVLAAWPLLFVALAGTRWFGAWLVDRRPDTGVTRLILVSAGIPAAVITALLMLGLGAIGKLNGEMIGIWLLVVVVAYASAAVSITIEAVPSRMRALRARRGSKHSLTLWAVGATAALLLAIMIRPVSVARSNLLAPSSGADIIVEIPRPGARIVPVEQGRVLEVSMPAFGYLLVKNGAGTFAIAPSNNRRIYLRTGDQTIVICVLGTDDLHGGVTSPSCERPSLGWIADIFNAPTSFANRATVTIRYLGSPAEEDLGTLRRENIVNVSGHTVRFDASEPFGLYVPNLDRGNEPAPEERIFFVLERQRSDGIRASTAWQPGTALEAGTYRLCIRQFKDAATARNARTFRNLMPGNQVPVPTSYQQLVGLSCDSALLRPPPGGRGFAFLTVPERSSFHEAVTRNAPSSEAVADQFFSVRVPSILLADFDGASGDPVLYLVRVDQAGRETQIAMADDPEQILARLEHGNYRLCARRFGASVVSTSRVGDSMVAEARSREASCGGPAVAGALSYRLVPLDNLRRPRRN